MNQNETTAIRTAVAALDEALARLKPCAISVTTDYAVHTAISRLEDARADLARELIDAEPPARKIDRIKLPGRATRDQNCSIE